MRTTISLDRYAGCFTSWQKHTPITWWYPQGSLVYTDQQVLLLASRRTNLDSNKYWRSSKRSFANITSTQMVCLGMEAYQGEKQKLVLVLRLTEFITPGRGCT